LVCNEAQRICWRSAASEGGNLTRLASRLDLGDPDKDVAISCSSRFVARLYDQKKSCASSNHNINKLQVKLATSRDASLVRLPP
jgi:hypothetical protein